MICIIIDFKLDQNVELLKNERFSLDGIPDHNTSLNIERGILKLLLSFYIHSFFGN